MITDKNVTDINDFFEKKFPNKKVFVLLLSEDNDPKPLAESVRVKMTLPEAISLLYSYLSKHIQGKVITIKPHKDN